MDWLFLSACKSIQLLWIAPRKRRTAITFELTKLLSLLLYPLSQGLLLCLSALLLLLFHFRRTAMAALLLAVAWLYLCSTALVADFLMGTLERDYRPRSMSVQGTADAIVLLGGAGRSPDLCGGPVQGGQGTVVGPHRGCPARRAA